ncbi:MAG: cysteine--tRNA ligase [Deltaproteobacteria bacterium]|nr:cysteine--tRNA ligase [Deltaproteobacteria bacterium]
MGLHIYNTLTKTKEEFIPLEPGRVKIYVCGITAYDHCHIGHARSAIVFDVIYRYFMHLGYEVVYVRNITDVDDKIIRRANEEGVDFRTIVDRYVAEYHQDMDSLGVLPPSVEPLATENIPHMIQVIQTLVEKGFAYKAGSDVYFQVDRFPRYGRLSGRQLEDMMAGARVEVDANKRNPLDFVLWKGCKPGEPAWDSPWGRGRPGWHIECSAMGNRYLGMTFDIHGGGKDLIFPHHENEIAQSEAAFERPFVRYWVHNGFVNVNNEKMSKSLGNFFVIRDVLKTVHPEALRLFVLSKHYRSPLDYADESIVEAERGLDKLYSTIGSVMERVPEATRARDSVEPLERQDPELLREISLLPERFREAMDNDFNTAQAIGYLFSAQRHLQRFLDRFGQRMLRGPAATLASQGAAVVRDHARILGLLTRSPEEFFEEQKDLKLKAIGLTREDVERLLTKRDQARSLKDFSAADRYRQELHQRGVQLEDTPKGTRWRVLA